MRKTLGAFALAMTVLSAAFVGAGCKKGSPIVGKWTTEAGSGTINWEFKPDGKATMAAKTGPVEVTAQETYKLEGEKLTLTVKSVDVKGGAPGQADYLKKFSKSQIGSERVDKVQFSSDDQVSITDPKGNAVTLTRVKE